MARPVAGSPPRIDLGPRSRVMAGWLAALLLVAGVAFVVGRLGDQAGGSAASLQPAASGTGGLLAISFGTVLGADGQVDPASRTERFAAGDNFAYSLDLAPPPGGQVYVEVVQVAGGASGPIQTPAPQTLPEGRRTVGFQVAAQALLDAFGPGEYVMRIYGSAAGAALGEGRFVLLGDVAPSAT
ncbi:MAG: hypothetical protein ACRDGJ_01295 [Candidatus Limnocylindria bacterium]